MKYKTKSISFIAAHLILNLNKLYLHRYTFTCFYIDYKSFNLQRWWLIKDN